MEKINKAKPPMSFESDFILRILAIAIAIIVWVILSITQYPTTTLKVSNIPVIFSLEGTAAEEKGLRAVGYQNITTTVEIKGMKYEIGGYTEKDLVASVNLDQVTKEGTYSLAIVAKSAHSSDQCEILSCYPETVEVTFEHYGEETFDIEVEAPDITTENDSIQVETTISPEQIKITGSDENLKKINRVAATVKDSKTLSEDTTISTSELVFYDDNGNKLPSSNYTVDNQNFDVTFSLYKKKTVTLNVDFKDCPTGFKISTLPYKLSKDKIEIATSDISGSSVATITVGTISLAEVDLSKSFEFDIPFEKDEQNLSSTEKVTVSFDDSGYTKNSFAIAESSFTILNKPSGKNVEIKSPASIKATIIGPESVLSNITASELTAEIDLDGVTKNGTVTKKITVYSKEYNNIWCYGTYEAEIVISDK